MHHQLTCHSHIASSVIPTYLVVIAVARRLKWWGPGGLTVWCVVGGVHPPVLMHARGWPVVIVWPAHELVWLGRDSLPSLFPF